MKDRILEVLGETALVLPTLLEHAIEANDRVKYYFSLLQLACAHAENPAASSTSLRSERLNAAIEDAALDEVIAGSRQAKSGEFEVPHLPRILAEIDKCLVQMLEPVQRAVPAEADKFTVRIAALWSAIGHEQQSVDKEKLRLISSGDRERADSLHLVVMDLHKALNSMQADLAPETIEGAKVYGIEDRDRRLITAFMEGLNRTAYMKLDHPGLSTTATRVGGRLILQNDIGTTDAHVIVIRIDGVSVSVTYTDVHLPRLIFFQGMLANFPVKWDDTRSRNESALEDGMYHLSTGVFAAKDEPDLVDYLRHLGSRLVFLIDWNRARKRLQRFLSKKAAIGLLAWAAEQEVGHMPFLSMGAEQLVYDALEFVSKGAIRPGETMEDKLGVRNVSEYLKFVLKTCSEARSEGASAALVVDKIRAELFGYLRNVTDELYDLASDHAGLLFEIAGAVHAAIVAPVADSESLARLVARTGKWESLADKLLNQVRERVREDEAGKFFLNLLSAADDVADELEEAAHHFSLNREPLPAPETWQFLSKLSELAVSGTQEFVKALECARVVHRSGEREDMQAFLESTHRIRAIEHAGDGVERQIEASLLDQPCSMRQLYSLMETAGNLEAATDALMHSALMLRDHVLNQAGEA
jgi:uncharacterized protein Yka (UPF0111/DUF47 family)